MNKFEKIITKKIGGYCTDLKGEKIRDLSFKDRLLKIEFDGIYDREFGASIEGYKIYLSLDGSGNWRSWKGLSLIKSEKTLIFSCKEPAYLVMSDEVYNEIIEVIEGLEKEYFDIDIDYSFKHDFEIDFYTCGGCHTKSTSFTEVMRNKLIKEMSISKLTFDDASYFIVKRCEEKNGLTYDEIKSAIKEYILHRSNINKELYDAIQNTPSEQELRDSGNDCIADELYRDDIRKQYFI